MPTATATPSTLAELQSFFQDQIASSGQVAITEANLGIPGLTTYLNNTIGPNLLISDVTLALADTTLGLTGVLTFLGVGFHTSLMFTEANNALSFSLNATQVSGTSISLTKVVAQLVPAATNSPTLALSNLQITLNTADTSFLFGASVGWQIPLGLSQPTIQASLVITQSSANLSGALVIGSSTFGVSYVFQKGGQVLTGSWADPVNALSWDSVVSSLGLDPALELNGNVGTSGFQSAQLTLDFGSDQFSLAGQTVNGAAFLMASKQASGTSTTPTWGFAFGAAVANDWTFSHMASSLSVLDFLVFQQAYLLVSSFTLPQFVFPGFSLMTTPIDVVPGLNFGAMINFATGTSSLAKSVYSLVGTGTASVEGSIGTLANTRIAAGLGGSMLIPPTKNLRLTNPQFIVIAAGPVVEVQGTLEVTLSSQVIDIMGRLAISPEKASFTVDVKGKSLLAPFGFTGVALEEIGVSMGIGFTPPSLDLALEAIFRIGDTPADKCAIEFEVVPDAVNPILLWGQFSSLSFFTIFRAMFPKNPLPAALNDLGLQNAYVYYCEQPTVLPDNTSAAPGFAISGTLNAYAFVMAAALKIDFAKGVSGSAAMTPIHLMNNALSVTGTGSLGGPAVAFSTVSSPYLDVTFDVSVLGVVGLAINGTVTSSGFTFNLAFVIANVLSEILTCQFKDSHNFSASTDLHFALNLTIGPLRAPKTNVNLGTIHINTQFTGHLDLAITSTAIQGNVNGSFDGRQLPSVSLNQSTTSLKQIPDMVINQIKAQANTIYSDVLSDATKWAGMVSSGVITGADDAGSVLTGYFGQSTTAAQALLQQFKLKGNITVHVDTSTPHVDTPSVHVDVAAIHTDQAGPHVDVARSHIDTSTPHGDSSVFGHHVDAGGHVDNTITPHGDTKPHVDTQVTPHADSATLHGDTTPHIDTKQHIDV